MDRYRRPPPRPGFRRRRRGRDRGNRLWGKVDRNLWLDRGLLCIAHNLVGIRDHIWHTTEWPELQLKGFLPQQIKAGVALKTFVFLLRWELGLLVIIAVCDRMLCGIVRAIVVMLISPTWWVAGHRAPPRGPQVVLWVLDAERCHQNCAGAEGADGCAGLDKRVPSGRDASAAPDRREPIVLGEEFTSRLGIRMRIRAQIEKKG